MNDGRPTRPPFSFGRSAAELQKGRRQGALLWAGVAVSLVVLSPWGHHFAALTGACPVKTWLGVPCPTCGTTRSALALARFDVVEALVLYPLPTLGWIALIGGGLGAGVWALSGRPLPGLPRNLPLGLKILLPLAVLANWVYSWQTGV